MRLGRCPRCEGTGKSVTIGRKVDALVCQDCGKKFYIPQDCDEPISWFEYILAETFGFADNLIPTDRR